MKPYLLLVCIFLGLSCFSQNGWEFLSWKMKKAEVEKVLSARKDLERGSMLDANFDFTGMSTWLLFNVNEELVKVDQRKTFSVIHDKEAKDFYEKRMEYMISKYGKPAEKEHDRKNDRIIVLWKLPLMSIRLEYDYKYKVIDEFGAGSYWVEIEYKPSE